MKTKIITLIAIVFTSVGFAQTIWTGPTITFTKADGADWTQEANQDRITDNVWITRRNNQGIFNIKTENSFSQNSSPADTEWAFGTTANIASLTFQNWRAAVNNDAVGAVGQDMVVHLITDDIYIDIKVTAWGQQSTGAMGSFTYERSTEGSGVGISETQKTQLSIFPNPAKNEVSIQGLEREINVEVFSITGEKVLSTATSSNMSIDISSLETGIYFIKPEGFGLIKFVKN